MNDKNNELKREKPDSNSKFEIQNVEGPPAKKMCLGETLNEGTEKMHSSPEASFEEESLFEHELEVEDEEIAEELEAEKRSGFAEQYEKFSKEPEFWKLLAEKLFSGGYYPHVIDIGNKQFIGVFPLNEDEIDDYQDLIDSAYIKLRITK